MSQIYWEGLDEKAYLTPNEVAKLLMVSPVTVRQWASKGDLGAELTPGGHRRFRPEEVRRFAEERLSRKSHSSGGPRKVLIVDDDIHLVNCFAEFIHQHDESIRVERAHDGFEAGCKIGLFNPDLVVLDIMMPGIDGFEVCKQIKSDSSTSHINVIAITGLSDSDTHQKILQQGARQCLSKPVSKQVFLESLGLRTVEYA